MFAKLPHLLCASAFLLLSSCAAPSGGSDSPASTAAPTGPAALSSNLVEGLAASPVHGRFFEAIRAAGLEATLSSAGPYTIFAPINDALDRLPKGTMESLKAPQNRALFAGLLNYHVVPGLKTRAEIVRDAGGSVATYRTLHGGFIRVSAAGGEIVATDHHGNRIRVSGAEAVHANGVLHTMDGVLLPQT